MRSTKSPAAPTTAATAKTSANPPKLSNTPETKLPTELPMSIINVIKAKPIVLIAGGTSSPVM